MRSIMDTRPAVDIHRRRILLAALLITLASSVPLASCGLPRTLETTLFEGVPPVGTEVPLMPVVRKPRRPAYIPAGQLARLKEDRPNVEEKPATPDWKAEYQKLPRAKDATVDWNLALNEKLITPKPGIDPQATEQPVFDYVVELVPTGLPVFKVVFPHKTHTQWLGCANCHPEIFEMKKGANEITMAKIFAGEFCGRCHGKVSFALTNCVRCHQAMPQ